MILSPSIWRPWDRLWLPRRPLRAPSAMMANPRRGPGGKILRSTSKIATSCPTVDCACCTGGKAAASFIISPEVSTYFAIGTCYGSTGSGEVNSFKFTGSFGFFNVPGADCSYYATIPYAGLEFIDYEDDSGSDTCCTGGCSNLVPSTLIGQSVSATIDLELSCGTDEDTGDPFYTADCAISWDMRVTACTETPCVGLPTGICDHYPIGSSAGMVPMSVGGTLTQGTPLDCLGGFNIPIDWHEFVGIGPCFGGGTVGTRYIHVAAA